MIQTSELSHLLHRMSGSLLTSEQQKIVDECYNDLLRTRIIDASPMNEHEIKLLSGRGGIVTAAVAYRLRLDCTLSLAADVARFYRDKQAKAA